jgi:hypothetical protein
MEEPADPRALHLYDLADYDVIEVRCPCGRIAEYMPGLLQRRYRVSSDVLVYDLQFRLRCRHCNRRSGFRIAIVDGRARGDRRVEPQERVIVPGEVGRGEF